MTLCKAVDGQLVPLTADEIAAREADRQNFITIAASRNLLTQAKKEIDASDITFIRCGKAGIAWPPEWQAYVTALRTIIDSGEGDIPTKPDYPAGS